ncbi:MAG: bifunctional 3-(3-hydroxy-phenyl)propionate/3-hydroxycinnamic acid hydroxylase [Nocardioides sp.]|uniref:bifunctional 3-(3-hydroxy-phenyl)propionate/3-hydroxycinnamic acid hydroxylase n=1 Tax=Nocardioides sp. TaxID=35761 RepID=UPI0039E3EEF2
MNTTYTQDTYDVVVAGLGPTGLTLAHLLGRRGMRVLIFEREPEFYGLARAVYTDDEALRVFQTAGVADEIHADMNVDSIVQWVREDGSILTQFRNHERPLWWPITNFLYQPFLETRMADLLDRYPNVEIRRAREVVKFTQDDDGVDVVHAAATGSDYGKRENTLDEATAESVRASFLIGADGGRSVVRTQLGIEMRGKSYPERWLVVDLKAKDAPGGGLIDAFRHLPYFDFVCSPTMPTVSCPQPGGHHRFEFALSDEDDKAHFEDDATVRSLIGRYVNPDEVEVLRQLVYTFNAVLADRWRDGRVLLAGDAAHMTPQFIGQGMNAGVRDADNLSWKIQAILQHGASLDILDTYQTERFPHAKAMIDLSVFNKSLVSIHDPRAAKARDLGMWAALRTPALGAWVRRAGMKPKPVFKKSAYLGLARSHRGVEGTLFPQPEVRRYDGRLIRFDDAVGIGWTVIGVEVDPRDLIDTALWQRVDATYTTLFAPGSRPQGTVGDGRRRIGLIDLEDTTGELTGWLRRAGIKPGSLVVLRPDKFVFGASRDPQVLDTALTSQMGLSQ